MIKIKEYIDLEFKKENVLEAFKMLADLEIKAISRFEKGLINEKELNTKLNSINEERTKWILL